MREPDPQRYVRVDPAPGEDVEYSLERDDDGLHAVAIVYRTPEPLLVDASTSLVLGVVADAEPALSKGAPVPEREVLRITRALIEQSPAYVAAREAEQAAFDKAAADAEAERVAPLFAAAAAIEAGDMKGAAAALRAIAASGGLK